MCVSECVFFVFGRSLCFLKVKMKNFAFNLFFSPLLSHFALLASQFDIFTYFILCLTKTIEERESEERVLRRKRMNERASE